VESRECVGLTDTLFDVSEDNVVVGVTLDVFVDERVKENEDKSVSVFDDVSV
jgi:hypothetical protein